MQSVNKNPWEAFGADVTAWRYHLGLLALGTANGRMAVYHARDSNQFDETALLSVLKIMKKAQKMKSI